MSIKIKYNDNLMKLLKSIFYSSPTDVDDFLPLVKDTKFIQCIIPFSTKLDISNQVDKSNGISLIFYLSTLFAQNNDLIPLFHENCIKNGINLLEGLLLPFYLHEKVEGEELTLIKDTIQKMIGKVSTPKTSIEFIYQSLSKYFKSTNQNKLSASMFFRHLKLLNIFYTDPSAENKKDIKSETKAREEYNKKKIKDIKNFIYFNGLKSGITLLLNKTSNNPNTDLPTIENGFTIVFWVNLNKELLKSFFESIISPGMEVFLFRIFVGGHHIALLLKDYQMISVVIDDNESNVLNIANIINSDQWNCFVFMLDQKHTKKKESIKVVVNGTQLLTTIALPKGFNCNEKIDTIVLFENFLGKVTSFMFFSFPIDQKMQEFFESPPMTYGFYKNKVLFRYLHSIDKDYYKTAVDYKYFTKYKNDKVTGKIFNMNINLRDQNINNLICCFCPFTFDKNKKVIDDVFGNLYGKFRSDDDVGVNIYKNQKKDINLLGGINNILPILELMLMGLNSNYSLIDPKLLCEETLYEYLSILKKILYRHKLNIIEANNNQFFSSLALFLEKFPSVIFTSRILTLFLDICQETLNYKDIIEDTKAKEKLKNDDESLNSTFISMILLNEKIISKFSPENQLKLWEGVNQFFKNDSVDIGSTLSVEKIGMLLRFYDRDRYEKYCCKKHASLFGCENDQEVMNPDMNLRVGKLFEAIQIYIDKVEIGKDIKEEKSDNEEKEETNFYKLLSLDLSPCLQKKIVQAYVFHFINVKISNNFKEKTLMNLLNNKYFELTEYAIGVSLLDVRTEILKLLQIFLVKYNDDLQKYLSSKRLNYSQIFSLISHQILPTHLKIYDEEGASLAYDIDENVERKRANATVGSESPSKRSHRNYDMTYYFNKKIYETDINSLWSSLSSSVTYNAPNKESSNISTISQSARPSTASVQSIKSNNTSGSSGNANSSKAISSSSKADNNFYINTFVLSFSIDFLLHVPQNYYIDSFLVSVYSTISNENIANQSTFFSNRKLYPWIIDTIFHFHRKENVDRFQRLADIEGKESKIMDNVKDIQKHSLKILDVISSIKANPKDLEDALNYILEYSYFKKNKYKDDPEKQKEIVKITKTMMERIMKFEFSNFDIKTIYCFEFILLYKSDNKIYQRSFERTEHHKENTFTDKDFKEMFAEKRDSAQDSDDILKKMQSCDTNEGPDLRKSECIHSKTLPMEHNNSSTLNCNTETSEDLIFDAALIPDYIYESVNYLEKTEENKAKGEKSKKPKKILKNKWSDYDFYSQIINYYSKHLWGGELICSKVKIKYAKDKIFFLCKDLYKLYCDNKEYKNILAPDITKCLLFDYYENSLPRNNINILNINLILLCLSIDICDDLNEREQIIHELIEFLIFCMLASLNILQTEPAYNYFQKSLYDIIGFGITFLQQRDEVKYEQLVYYMTTPINEDLNEQNLQGIKKIFGSSSNKKQLLKPTAVYKLFILPEIPGEKESIKECKTNKGAKEGRKKGASGSVPPKRPSISSSSSSSTEIKKVQRKNSNEKVPTITNFSCSRAKSTDYRINGLALSKNIFQKTLNFYKSERDSFYLEKLILFYEDADAVVDPNEDEKIEQEKKRVSSFIKKLVPSLISEIKKFSNVSYLEEKRRRNIYKKNKKNLFSWKGFWSDKELFFNYPEKLKLKIKNHFTKEMTKIVLTPILDQKYYLPNFSKFEISNLYNKDDYEYNVNLDIDEILDVKEIKDIKASQKEKEENEKIVKNIYGFNYLESLYKYQFPGIWGKYQKDYEQSISQEATFKSEDIFSTIVQNKIAKANEENKDRENLYICCMVKPTHHIKGLLRTEKTTIRFTYCPQKKETLEQDPGYDKDMGACFGSTFKMHNKDKDKLFFEIKYKNIEFILFRTYFYQETAVEIYTFDHRSYFFNFSANDDLNKFINNIKEHENFRNIKCHGYKNKRLIGYGKLFNVYQKKKSYHVSHKAEEWQNNNISTLEYLMWCNIFSGRSYNDLTQYPVMPWVHTNYESDMINNEDFRNLSIPVGMFEMNEKAETRKYTFLEFYQTLKNDLKEANPDFNYQDFLEKLDGYLEHYQIKKRKKISKEKEKTEANVVDINQIPFLYGSHYSNPTYVSHFLTRIFPFASISIEIHGDKFDDPNRMFFSLKRTFETASTLKDDVRELIPEFFQMPEMFLNNNNFNLSQNRMDSEGNEILINNVELPPWSNHKSTNFIVEMRNILERYELKINKWIDLIFGILQKGKNAEECHNIFMLNTYENMVKIENIKDEDERNALMRLVEVGVTPHQIFGSESKTKIDKNTYLTKNPIYSFSKGAYLSESTELKYYFIESHKYNKLNLKLYDNKKLNKDFKEEAFHQLIKIKALSHNELKIISNTNYWFNFKFNRNDNNDNNLYSIQETSLRELSNISSKYACSYRMSGIEIPIIIYGNNKYIIKGGFWDGRIEINTLPPDSKEESGQSCFVVDEGPVVVMKMDKEEKILVCGTKSGFLLVFDVDGLKITLNKKIICHNDEITSISINDTLNMIATSSLDGYVNLLLLPSFELVRSIKLSTKYGGNISEDEDLLYANNVFLSSTPLPCVTFFIGSKRLFRSFTINGEFIAENYETQNSNEIRCPIVFNNLSFFDFLLYGTNDGLIKIRSFPEMKIVNSIKLLENNQEIISLELSLDKRYCYAWIEGDKIIVIKDISVNDSVNKNKK